MKKLAILPKTLFMKKQLLPTVALLILSACGKDDSGTPTPNNPNPSQQKCKPVSIEFVAELGTNGTTHWADSFVLDASQAITQVVHKYSVNSIIFNYYYNSGRIIKIDRIENGSLYYTDSLFWNSNNMIERVKVYHTTGLSKDILFTYSGLRLMQREINYYPSNDYLKQTYTYGSKGELLKTEFYDKAAVLEFSYTYSYLATGITNKLYDNSQKVLQDLHWNMDDWETAVYDVFNYSTLIPSTIQFTEKGSPTAAYTIATDTNSNGYVTRLKSNGHDVTNINYQCK